jgi:two-component system sensor histidine kinase SenX3
VNWAVVIGVIGGLAACVLGWPLWSRIRGVRGAATGATGAAAPVGELIDWTEPAGAADRQLAGGSGDNGRTAITKETKGRPSGLGRKGLDSLQVGVLVLDPDDTPVLVNPSARAMGLLRAGAEPGAVAAHPIIRTLAGQVRRTGVRREVELDLPRGREGGAQDPLGVHLRAVGLPKGYVAVEAADVTEAHRVARVRRDFVANVSHELKTPIGALQLLSEALLDATDPGSADAPDAGGDVAAARRFAERIQHESIRLGRLVNELLELSRLQGADPLPPPEPVQVDWIIAEVLDRTRTAAAAKQIEVAFAGQRGLTLYGSDSQFATAVVNLVENAIAYSPAGTKVTVSTRGDDKTVRIVVADHGIGIAAHEIDRIFERFYRSDRARSRATGGTGLGLAIVKHIATNHGGRVDVTSAVGRGSTFTLRLPARPRDAAGALPASVEIEPDPAPFAPLG